MTETNFRSSCHCTYSIYSHACSVFDALIVVNYAPPELKLNYPFIPDFKNFFLFMSVESTLSSFVILEPATFSSVLSGNDTDKRPGFIEMYQVRTAPSVSSRPSSAKHLTSTAFAGHFCPLTSIIVLFTFQGSSISSTPTTNGWWWPYRQ